MTPSLDGSSGIITIRNLRSRWRPFDLDMRTGSFRTRWRMPGQPLGYFGIGMTIWRRRFERVGAAAYETEGEKLLQIGQRHWRLADPSLALEVAAVRGPVREFSVRRNGGVEYSVRYWSSIYRSLGAFDPDRHTTDGDFFLELWSLWRDPKWRHTTGAWSRGWFD